MQKIDQMSPRQKDEIVRDLELEHRIAIVDAAKLKRELKRIAGELDAKEERISEIEYGISILRE